MRRLPADATVGTAQTRPATAATSDTRKPRRVPPGWLLVAVPASAEFLVGGYRIGGPSLWRDEAATISGAQRPAGAIVALIRNQDAVHGLYYLLMHAVIAVGGTSETVVRLPSLIAMCMAVALTAVLGRRLALAAALPAPGAVGLLAGLLLTAVPLTTRYAQEARPYALTTLFAVLATYLLLRAAGSARWRWWAGYGAALAATGLFNLFAILIAMAHGISLIAARPVAPAAKSSGHAVAGDAVAGGVVADGVAGGVVADGWASRWLTACVAAAVLLAPIAAFSGSQSAQLNWVTRPDLSTLAALARDFAGASLLIPVAAVLGWLGCIAGRGVRRGDGLTLAVVALPWLVLPPAALIAVSLVHPVFVERYVVFCLPALCLLMSAGLVWLGRLTRQAAVRRGMTGRSSVLLAIVPSGVLAVGVTIALIGPQGQIRLATARPDDLRAVAATVARYERPGDAILYLPWDTALVGEAYPAPFERLRDIGLGLSPIASETLRGLPARPSVTTARLSGVRRVWTITWARPLPSQAGPPADLALARAVGGLRLIRRWRIASVVLSLYQAR